MAFEIVPFLPAHLENLHLQSAQTSLQEIISNPDYGHALKNKYTMSGIADDQVVGIAGIQPIWPGRALAWALVSESIEKKHWAKSFVLARTVIQSAHADGFKRLELTVDETFEPGHRLAVALGFSREGGLARAFTPDGQDHIRYERIAE